MMLLLLLISSLLSYVLHRLAFGMQGIINIKGGHTQMPSSPPEIPSFQHANKKMAYVYVTDYMFNSGLMAAFVNKKLTRFFNNSKVSVAEATRFYEFFSVLFSSLLLV